MKPVMQVDYELWLPNRPAEFGWLSTTTHTLDQVSLWLVGLPQCCSWLRPERYVVYYEHMLNPEGPQFTHEIRINRENFLADAEARIVVSQRVICASHQK